MTIHTVCVCVFGALQEQWTGGCTEKNNVSFVKNIVF